MSIHSYYDRQGWSTLDECMHYEDERKRTYGYGSSTSSPATLLLERLARDAGAANPRTRVTMLRKYVSDRLAYRRMKSAASGPHYFGSAATHHDKTTHEAVTQKDHEPKLPY